MSSTTSARATRLPIDYAREILDSLGGEIPFGPRANPCVCGAPQGAHAGPTSGGSCKVTGCLRYRVDRAWELAYEAHDASQRSIGQTMRMVDRTRGAARRKANPVLPGQWRIGVSDTDTCPRAIQYRNKPPEGMVLAWEDKREALMGTIFHDAAEDMMREAYPWRIFEQSLDVPGLDRQSRFDWYDPIKRTLGDIKTAGDWRWDKLGDEGPTEETWSKVHIYGLAAIRAGLPVTTVRLDYIKRCNGHDEGFEEDYSEEKARAALDVLTGYATMLDLDIDLPKTGTGPTHDAICQRCPFRVDCWNMDAAEAIGRSPESYTRLGPTPEDEDIEFVIREKHAAAVARLAAEKVEEQKKALLEGIEPGGYGDMEGYTSGGGGGQDNKAYAAALADELAKPPGQQRPLDTIEIPRQARWTTVKWGPVRKAVLAAEARAAKAAEKARLAAEKAAS